MKKITGKKIRQTSVKRSLAYIHAGWNVTYMLVEMGFTR